MQVIGSGDIDSANPLNGIGRIPCTNHIIKCYGSYHVKGINIGIDFIPPKITGTLSPEAGGIKGSVIDSDTLIGIPTADVIVFGINKNISINLAITDTQINPARTILEGTIPNPLVKTIPV